MKTEYIPPYVKTVQRLVDVPVDVPAEVILSLTLDEALYLIEICNHIGGTPSGPRGNFDRIHDRLNSAIPEDVKDRFHFPKLDPAYNNKIFFL